jgi:predicted transcriptional regulator
MQETLQKTHATLTTLKAQEEGRPPLPMPAPELPPVDWRTSITKYAVTCLECGQTRKQLTRRHLMTHRLDTRLYRLKYDIPPTQPLAARQTTTRRRQIVQATRLWEKAAQLRKWQAQTLRTATEPDGDTFTAATQEPSAEVIAQPKRQRKTPRKKRAAG